MWISNNKLAQWEYQSTTKDVKKDKILKIRLLHAIDSSIMCKIYNQAANIFYNLQKINHLENKINTNILVTHSLKYRAIIKSAILELQESDIVLEKNDEICILSEIEFLWNLIEIIFFDENQSDYIIIQLIRWISWHFTEPTLKLYQLISEKNDGVLQNLETWNIIYALILQGQVDLVFDFLSSQYLFITNEIFRSCLNLLEGCPIMKIVDKPPLNKNVPNFEILHKLWSKECSHMLEILTDHKFDDTDDININIVKTGISNVLKILTGEDGIFAELANSQPWYSTFVSTLFYQSPTVTIQDIPFNLQEFFRKICPNVKDNLNQLDTIIISIFELDHFSVLTELCQYNNDWWFPAHVSDLFARILDLKTPCVKADCDLREYIILEFVSNFSDHGSLWSIMPIYLDACVKFGKAHLQIYLSKMSLDNEFKAHKIMELCEERNFSLLVRSICRQMATNYININQYGSALHWAFNGKDFDMSDYIVLKILNSNENLKENTHFNVVGNLGRYSHETSLLAYLTKVKEMVDLYEEKSYDKVETLILTLLNQPLPSASFGFVLLRFIGEFLNQTSIKDPHAIYELMRWVGETFSLKPVDSLREDQKLFIRLVVQALSQNLSATFVKREPIFCMSQDTNIKENENQIYTI